MNTSENKIRITKLPEVTALLEEAGADRPEAVSFEKPTEPTLPPQPPKKKKKDKHSKRGLRIALIVVGCLLLAAVGGAVAVAEPWVPAPVDNYVEPLVTELPARTVAVSEEYAFPITLGENEMIADVALTDPDILSVSEDLSGITGLGEYFSTTVNITTTEIAVPEKVYAHEIVLFGKDFTEPYDRVRSVLRDLIGVEELPEERTELRVLARYTQNITVRGLDNVTVVPTEEVSTYLQNGVILETAVSDEESIQLYTYNDNTVSVTYHKHENGAAIFTAAGVSEAHTNVLASIGFWKQVSPEIYTDYLASLESQTGAAPIYEQRENQIFVPQRAVLYNIGVTDLDQPIVTTDLNAAVERDIPENGQHEEFARELMELINDYRIGSGLSALNWSFELADAARSHAESLPGSYVYSLPEGAADMNISAGYLTPQDVFTAWKVCDSLHEAMISPDYTVIGASYFRHTDDTYNNYWCALFA